MAYADGKRPAELAARVRDLQLPVAFVDLAAFDANLARLLAPARAHGKSVRLASKSLRCPALIERAIALSDGQIHGLMTFTARETLLWAERGARDLLLGYPLAGPHDAALLVAANRTATAAAMIDCPEHIAWLAAAARGAERPIPVWLDLDLGWRPLAGVHVGVRRSPLRRAEDVVALARQVAAEPGLKLAGLMGYEAHLAGLPDDGQLARWQNPVKRWLKRRSWPDVLARRAAALGALQAAHLLADGIRLACNGGGSGSVDRTVTDASVTEITMGSGLLAGHLFDGYRGLELQPALHFALAITRRSSPEIATCAGGGWIASGSAGTDRLPLPVHPCGARLLAVEGAGEVQTPVRLGVGTGAGVGDPVLFRPAKSGELAECFAAYTLLDGGGRTEQVATYRGLGWSAWG